MRNIEALTYRYYAEVVEKAHDGDTIKLLIDLGYDNFTKKNIRLQNINAAEINDVDPQVREQAVAAREYLRSLLPIGTKVIIFSEKFRQSFTRYVGFIHLSDGQDVGKLMLDAGFAVRVLVDK